MMDDNISRLNLPPDVAMRQAVGNAVDEHNKERDMNVRLACLDLASRTRKKDPTSNGGDGGTTDHAPTAEHVLDTAKSFAHFVTTGNVSAKVRKKD